METKNSESSLEPSGQDLASQGQALRASEEKPNKPKRNISFGKILVAGFIILITLLAFGLIAYLFLGNQDESKMVNDNSSMVNEAPSPIPVPIADWETYTNEEYKYSFSYDENLYQFVENQKSEIDPFEKDEGMQSSSFVTELLEGAYKPGFSVTVYENLKNFPLDQWMNESDGSFLKQSPINKLADCIIKDPRTKTTENDYLDYQSFTFDYYVDDNTVELMNDGTCESQPLEGGGHYKSVFIEKDDIIIELKIGAIYDGNETILNQILSTFKFTDAESKNNTTNSYKINKGEYTNTFIDEKNGFTFKYDNNLKECCSVSGPSKENALVTLGNVAEDEAGSGRPFDGF